MNSVSKRDRLRWALLLVAACAVVYANGVTGAFTYDDKAVVRDNPRIHSPHKLREIFTTSYFGGRGSGTAYRPMLLLSFALQWWVHGKHDSPTGRFGSGRFLEHLERTRGPVLRNDTCRYY